MKVHSVIGRVFLFSAFTLMILLPTGSSLAGELAERIKTLEEVQRANAEELARLKGEQMELKKQATEAAAALPTFSHRPRSGLYIEAADKSWGLRFRGRFHYRLLTWPDSGDEDPKASSGFSNFDLALRRVRARINYFWDNRFYEFDWELDTEPNRNFRLQHGEFHVHFEKLNPYLPEFVVGPRISSFFNRHDTNWSSSTGGVFDRSMFQDGAGIGAGTQNNGIGLYWDDISIGSGTFLFQAIYSNQGLISIADLSRPQSDNRSAHVGFNIEPFSKSKSKWLKGIDLGIGYNLDQLGDSSKGLFEDDSGGTRDFFRVRTTERQRLRLIELGRDAMGQRHFLTPGFGWKVGPYWLRTAAGWNKGEQENGRGVEGWMWRIAHELFVWSPKGFLTGSVNTPGSIMFFTSFERNDYRAADNGLRNCGSGGGSCESAHASLANVGMWYFVQRGLSVGVEYGHYRVNKIGRGADDLENVSRGDDVNFNTLEFGIRYDF